MGGVGRPGARGSGGGGAGAWYGSDQSIKVVHYGTGNAQVLAVQGGTVTLARTLQTAAPGTYWLEWSGAHTMLGDVVSETPGRVTREVLRGPVPSAGTPGHFGNVPPGDPKVAWGGSTTPKSWCPPSWDRRPPGTCRATAPRGSSPCTGRTGGARPS
ncbi:hypothetical protein [Nonomuraea salmonea]|uniref:hypothetical protein n=1 Tax=Nonomuraea salmonea TaxID=46181 RepID=UPI0031F0592C